MTRVATFVQHNLSVSNLQHAQTRMSNAQVQISTGQNAQRYSGIATDSRRLVNFESLHAKTNQYIDNNRIIDLRMQMMETNSSSVLDMAATMRANLLATLNDSSADSVQLSLQAEHLLNEVGSLLNTRLDGRYLFSGTSTDVKPVDFSDPTFVPPGVIYPGTADTTYYQGDSRKLSLHADEDVDISYGINADDSAFEKTIRAMHLAATSNIGGTLDKARANEALRVINEALDILPGVVSKIGAVRATVEGISDKHQEYQLYTEQTISDIEAVDIAEALVRVNADSAALEASYAVLAKLSRLTLLDYIR